MGKENWSSAQRPSYKCAGEPYPHRVQKVLRFPCVTLISSGINGREQTLENGDMKVPFNLQNGPWLFDRSRQALEKAAGFRFNEHGLLAGSLFDFKIC